MGPSIETRWRDYRLRIWPFQRPTRLSPLCAVGVDYPRVLLPGNSLVQSPSTANSLSTMSFPRASHSPPIHVISRNRTAKVTHHGLWERCPKKRRTYSKTPERTHSSYLHFSDPSGLSQVNEGTPTHSQHHKSGKQYFNNIAWRIPKLDKPGLLYRLQDVRLYTP